MKKIITIILALLLMPFVNAQIAISSFETFPSQVSPGESIQLKVVLENVGDQDIKNVLVKLDLSQVPFAPLRSSTEKIIDEINDEDQVIIYFDLVALPSAESQIYKIPIKISYDNITKDSLISLEVNAKAKLDLILEESTLVKINDNGKVTLKLINNGLSQIKFLKITLQDSQAYESLSPNSIYIGQIDVDDFETAEYNIIPKIKNPQLNLMINYKDSNNNEFTENKYLTLKVYSEEEAKQLGLVKQSSLLTILIPILIIILIFFIYKKLKKKKHD